MQEFLPTQFATSVRDVHPALQLPEKRLGEAMKIILRIIKGEIKKVGAWEGDSLPGDKVENIV